MNAALFFIIKLSVILFIFVGIPAIYYLTLPQYKISDKMTNLSHIPIDKLASVGIYKVPTSGNIPGVWYNPATDSMRYYPGYFNVNDSSFTYIAGKDEHVKSHNAVLNDDNDYSVFLILSKNGKYNVDKDLDSATVFTTSALESKTFKVCSAPNDVIDGRYASTRGAQSSLNCYSAEPDDQDDTVAGNHTFKYL